MTTVIMPKMGDGMEEGTLLEWLKKEGDVVKSGEVIGTIQTDKATLELEAPGSGKLAGVLIKGGDTVPVGKPIAALLADSEKLPDGWGAGQAPTSKAEPPAKSTAPLAASEEAAAAQPQPVPAGQSSTPQSPSSVPGLAVVPSEARGRETEEGGLSARIKASPLAKKVAAERGIDLSTIKGTGPSGRIVEKDVVAAPRSQPPTQLQPVGEDNQIQISRLRQITAKRTAESKQHVPHFYVTVEVDVERIMQLRDMFEAEESGKVSVNDFVVKALALALREMPEVNASFTGPQTILEHGAVNIGIAVAISEGLTVAVIHSADQLPLRAISAKSKDLVAKAKENRLSLDELQGATFSISNMGMLDIDNFAAIISEPNSGIVAISTARKKVVVGDGDEIEIRWRMNVTASFDHRVVDGAVGAKFINVVKGYLENPTRLLA